MMSQDQSSATSDRSKSLSFITIAVVCLLGDILLIKGVSDIIIFSLLAFYIMGALFFQLRSKSTFYIALALSILMSLFYVFGSIDKADKVATWLFLFLLTGIIQELFNEN